MSNQESRTRTRWEYVCLVGGMSAAQVEAPSVLSVDLQKKMVFLFNVTCLNSVAYKEAEVPSIKKKSLAIGEKKERFFFLQPQPKVVSFSLCGVCSTFTPPPSTSINRNVEKKLKFLRLPAAVLIILFLSEWNAIIVYFLCFCSFLSPSCLCLVNTTTKKGKELLCSKKKKKKKIWPKFYDLAFPKKSQTWLFCHRETGHLFGNFPLPSQWRTRIPQISTFNECRSIFPSSLQRPYESFSPYLPRNGCPLHLPPTVVAAGSDSFLVALIAPIKTSGRKPFAKKKSFLGEVKNTFAITFFY